MSFDLAINSNAMWKDLLITNKHFRTITGKKQFCSLEILILLPMRVLIWLHSLWFLKFSPSMILIILSGATPPDDMASQIITGYENVSLNLKQFIFFCLWKTMPREFSSNIWLVFVSQSCRCIGYPCFLCSLFYQTFSFHLIFQHSTS